MKSDQIYSKSLLLYSLSGIIVYALCIGYNTDIPFSFDHVYLVSYVADHIYTSGFHAFIVDASVDTGHPPLAAFLHAFCWKIFGKSLVVSHWLMLPFIASAYFFFLAISRFLLPEKYLFIPALLFLVFPVLSAQCIYMSTDIMLLACITGAVYFLLIDKRFLYYVLLALSLLFSLRGIPLVIAFFITDIAINSNTNKKSKLTVSYLFAAVPFIIWNVYHLNVTGWMLVNTDSIWSDHRNLNSASTFFLQTAAFIFRLCEFGGIVIWILLILYRQQFYLQEKTRFIFYLLLSIIAMLALTLLPFANPVSTRYVLPVFVMGILLLSYQIVAMRNTYRILLLSVYFLLCLLSILCIYPERMIKAAGYSWDCTVVSLPYFTYCEPVMQQYINASTTINATDSIYAGMPFYQPSTYTKLTENNNNKSVRWERPDMPYGSYFIYSNMMNDITWEQKQWLETNWVLEADFRSGNMYTQIYRNPQLGP